MEIVFGFSAIELSRVIFVDPVNQCADEFPSYAIVELQFFENLNENFSLALD